MSGFKDMVAADRDAVFLNLEELAETHNLNGTKCNCILQDESVVEEVLTNDRYAQSYGGLYGSRLLVNVKTEDLPEVPVEGQTFYVDDKLYMVESSANDMGMLTIQLVANDR